MPFLAFRHENIGENSYYEPAIYNFEVYQRLMRHFRRSPPPSIRP